MDTSGLKQLLEGSEETLQNAQEIVIEEHTRQCSTPCQDEADRTSVISTSSTDVEEDEEEPRLPTPPPPPPAPEEPPKKKAKMETAAVTTILTLLMSLRPIRVDAYTDMFQKYKMIDVKGKMPKNMREALFKVLNFIGQLSKSYPGNSYIQQYTNTDLGTSLCTTSCGVTLTRKLKTWLKEFEQAGMANIPQPTAGREDSLLRPFMLPSPQHQQQTSATCTSSTIADGRISPAVARHSGLSTDQRSTSATPGLSNIYRPKTSSLYGSMSWKDHTNRYSVRSASVDGDFAVKLEVYNLRKVRGLPHLDWWKHADCRAFVPLQNRSQALQTAIRLQEEMRKRLEEQPDAEGEYQQMRF